jgi:hypothetical protein
MSLCSDFLNEQGMMQYIGTKLGVEAMLTPKCHAKKIAGEGVEYMWACANQRHIPEPGTEGKEGEFHGK